MWPGFYARSTPDAAAIIVVETGETVTYQELDDRSNRLAQLLYAAGLRFGDRIALCMENNARYLEVAWAAQRSGLVYAPVNSHFNADEVAYILDDCDAQALVTSAVLGDMARELSGKMPPAVTTRLVVGGSIDGYDDYEAAVARFPAEPLVEELEGIAMLYSSGTTGRPKGIRPKLARAPVGNVSPFLNQFAKAWGMDQPVTSMAPAPLYHSAPLQWFITTHRGGGTALVAERFDPEGALAAIERYRATHTQWVPTMFVRLLKLPDEVRNKYDLSSMRLAIHSAAPCPVPVKERIIEWWGPILYEVYSTTEAIGATMITSEQWLAHKGSVGRSLNSTVHILDDEGQELPPGQTGLVYFEPGTTTVPFEYHKDPGKTAATVKDNGWATVGDVGYVDDEGFLYLVDRKNFMIVSGGVNIYPQEAENVLVVHPKLRDAAVFGVPNEEMGEEVKAVVEPMDPADAGPDLEAELLAFCRDRLAHYKCPRSIDFEVELPRDETGKLYKRLLRERYWTGAESRIVL